MQEDKAEGGTEDVDSEGSEIIQEQKTWQTYMLTFKFYFDNSSNSESRSDIWRKKLAFFQSPDLLQCKGLCSPPRSWNPGVFQSGVTAKRPSPNLLPWLAEILNRKHKFYLYQSCSLLFIQPPTTSKAQIGFY